MPKMQVYLPEPLHEQVKKEAARLNVSAILQEALTERLADLSRRDALSAALADHASRSGAFTDEELDRQAAADRAATVYPRKRKKRSGAA